MLKPRQPASTRVPEPALGPNVSEQWPYSWLYDSVLAAPGNYRLLYEDGHVRLLEVAVRPGETTPLHGHPYPSVLAFDADAPDPRDIVDTQLDPASPLNGQGAGHAPPPSVLNMTAPPALPLPPRRLIRSRIKARRHCTTTGSSSSGWTARRSGCIGRSGIPG